MKKRILSFLLAAVLLLGLMPVLPLEANALFVWIKDPDEADGYDYTTSSDLAEALNAIFAGNANVYYDKNCTNLVNTTIGTSNVKNDGVYKYAGPYGGPAVAIGTSCWIYANGVYHTLFGDGTNGEDPGRHSVKLDIYTTSSQKATYANFKAWGVRQGVGAMVRGNGHSMIVLEYDADKITILDGNGDSNGLVSIRSYSWDQFKYTVTYIVQPEDDHYENLYFYCDHTYDALGYCSKCGKDFNFSQSYDPASSGYYTVTASGGINLKPERPYTAADSASLLIPEGTQVEILGSVTNAAGETWYQVFYNGTTGYTKPENLTFYEYGEQVITCSVTSPAEGMEVPQKSYPLAGTVTSQYPLDQVRASIDGGQPYAKVTLGRSRTLDLKSSDINNKLSFSRLALGPHTLTIEAKDIHHDEWITVCVRNFTTVSSSASTCSHTYEVTITQQPTCALPGVRTFTCKDCGASYTDTLPATGDHSYSSAVTTQETCGTDGVITWSCATCDDTYTESIPATGRHSYGAWVTIEETGCTTQGVLQRTCSVCQKVQTQYLEAMGHEYVETVTPPTCTEQGYTTHTCQNCADSYVDTYVETVDHTYQGVVTPPTFGNQGYTTYTCTGCANSYQADYVPALSAVTVGQTGYDSLEQALAEAGTGDVIRLHTDLDLTGQTLILRPDVTLDLGAFDLRADGLIGFNGSILEATRYSATGDYGKLIVPKENLVLSGGQAAVNGEYDVIPVWNGEDAYILANALVNDTEGEYGLKIDEENKTIRFSFVHKVGGSANNAFFKDGTGDNALKIIIRLEWASGNGVAYQDFVYNDDFVGLVSGGGYNYSFILNNYDILNIDLSNLKVTAMILTDAGTITAGQVWTQANAIE